MDIDWHDPTVRRNSILIGVASVLFVAAIVIFFLRSGEGESVPAPVQAQTDELVERLQEKQPDLPPDPPAPEPGSGKRIIGSQ